MPIVTMPGYGRPRGLALGLGFVAMRADAATNKIRKAQQKIIDDPKSTTVDKINAHIKILEAELTAARKKASISGLAIRKNMSLSRAKSEGTAAIPKLESMIADLRAQKALLMSQPRDIQIDWGDTPAPTPAPAVDTSTAPDLEPQDPAQVYVPTVPKPKTNALVGGGLVVAAVAAGLFLMD